MQKLMWTLVLVLGSSMATAADIPQLVGEVQALKAKATALKGDITKEMAKKEAAGKAIGKINRQLAPVQATIKALQGLTTPLDATQQALLTASLAQEVALKQDLADEVQERDDAQKAIDQATKDLDAVLTERSDKQDELSLLTSTVVHQTNQSVTTLDTKVDTLDAKVNGVVTDVKDLGTKVDQLTKDLASFRTELNADLDRRFDKLSQEQADQLTKFLNSVDEKLKAATSKEDIAAIKALTTRVLELTEKKIKQDKKTKYAYAPSTSATATTSTTTSPTTVYYFPQYNNGYTYSYPYTYSYCGSYPYYYSGRYWSYRWWL